MDTSEDQFQEEVLQLFAEEGLEWIKQIKVALQELESGVTLDKEKKHYDIILRYDVRVVFTKAVYFKAYTVEVANVFARPCRPSAATQHQDKEEQQAQATVPKRHDDAFHFS